MNTVISTQDLCKKYGNQYAVDHVNLEIGNGRIIGLIGPNGAGKTTLLKAILGLTTFSGELKVLGLDPRKDRDELMEQVSFIADVAVLPRWIRVSESIDLVEGLHTRFSREKCTQLLRKTKIRMDSKVKQLSKGMVAQLHLALVMSIDAKLLVLDEPTLGLDIIYRKTFYTNLLNDYFDEERTIIITTHQVEEIEHILSDLIFIRDGKIVLNSTMEEVQQSYFELMAPPESVDAARQLKPLNERTLFGKHIFLFQGIESALLEPLGEVRTPNVADLFVAVMGED
ncbi:MAG: ABC transporter ATP-binding protein [Xanthomonadales bacterium]|nr:ABC transporter ATP-binding protein [Xanthomonadales bacterium]